MFQDHGTEGFSRLRSDMTPDLRIRPPNLTILSGDNLGVFRFFVIQHLFNGLEPQAYLTDVLQRLPTQLDKNIHELLPTHWKPRPN
jgi:hypothetical protein